MAMLIQPVLTADENVDCLSFAPRECNLMDITNLIKVMQSLDIL